MYGVGFGDEADKIEGHVIFAARRRFVPSDFNIIFISLIFQNHIKMSSFISSILAERN
jgi:hypothetical protein